MLAANDTFFLERMLETVYYNMKRIKFEWYKIWAVVGSFFINTTKEITGISMLRTIINSLKQLCFKFFEEMQFNESHFQKDFLFTFSEITSNSCVEIIDLVLTCLHQIIQRHGAKISTGWYSVLKCLETSYIKSFSTTSLMIFDIWKEYSTKYISTSISDKTLDKYRLCFLFLLQSKCVGKERVNVVDIYRKTLNLFHQPDTLNTATEQFEFLFSALPTCCYCENLEIRSL